MFELVADYYLKERSYLYNCCGRVARFCRIPSHQRSEKYFLFRKFPSYLRVTPRHTDVVRLVGDVKETSTSSSIL